MGLPAARREAYLNTVWAIAASPYVSQYVIGYTARSGIERFRQYKSWGYDHLVLIADRLSRKDALDLEEYLHEEARKNRNTTIYQKYHEKRRDGPHYRRYGGIGAPGDAVHSVYMAWWE